MKYENGFTLIEILIVIVIISIIATTAVVTMSRHSQREYETIVDQLINTLTLAEQEAMLRPAILGFTATQHTFQFFILQQDKKTGKNKWVPATEPALKMRTLPDHIQLNLIVKSPSKVIIMPNNELTPFTLFIGKKGETPYYRVIGKENGEVVSERFSTP